MTETIGPIYTDLARQANALKEELNKAHVGHCSCDQCQQVDAELMAAPSLDEQIATLRGERDEARQQFTLLDADYVTLSNRFVALQGACEQLKAALRLIGLWSMPPPNDKGETFTSCYGSRGAEDLMRVLAWRALGVEMTSSYWLPAWALDWLDAVFPVLLTAPPVPSEPTK